MTAFPNHFKDYYNNKEFSDMIIRINNERDIWAHSIIMAESSPVVKTWITSKLRKNNIFEITDYDNGAVECAIKWIYGWGYGYEEKDFDKEQYINVLAVSHYLGLNFFHILTTTYQLGNMKRYLYIQLGMSLVELIRLAYLYDSQDLIFIAVMIYYDICYELRTSYNFSDITLDEYKMFYKIWLDTNEASNCNYYNQYHPALVKPHLFINQ